MLQNAKRKKKVAECMIKAYRSRKLKSVGKLISCLGFIITVFILFDYCFFVYKRKKKEKLIDIFLINTEQIVSKLHKKYFKKFKLTSHSNGYK